MRMCVGMMDPANRCWQIVVLRMLSFICLCPLPVAVLVYCNLSIQECALPNCVSSSAGQGTARRWLTIWNPAPLLWHLHGHFNCPAKWDATAPQQQDQMSRLHIMPCAGKPHEGMGKTMKTEVRNHTRKKSVKHAIFESRFLKAGGGSMI